MESPLTPGMSTMLDFADETFEYPALDYGTTPGGAKDIYGDSFTFSQKDWDAGNKFLNAFDSPGMSAANKDGIVEPAVTSAQTPALTTGPSAATNSSSASQASPSVAPDYFSRPRQPNSDGNSAHFVTVKPVESNNYSEFRKAINNRFNRAKAAISAAPSSTFSHADANQHAPPTNTDDSLMDFSFTDFDEAHQQPGQFRASDLNTVNTGADGRAHAPSSKFDQQDRAQPQSSSHYPEIDPDLAGGEGPGSAKAQPAFVSPPDSQGRPTIAGDTQPPPIKRRRRRKAPPSAEVKAQKHKAFLERNREAASKCRTKKKTQIQQLEEDERDGRAINQVLKDEFRDVLGEVLLLREQLKLQDLACGGNCGGKCGGVGEGDEEEEQQADTEIIMEALTMDGVVERDADANVEPPAVNRDGIVGRASGALVTSGGAGCNSDSDDGEEASDDEDLDDDQVIINNEGPERPPK